jgi:FAD binding domain
VTVTANRTGRSLICDRPFLWSYGLGRIKPFTRNIRRYVASGELVEAADIAQVAAKIGIKPSILAATIANYNSDAKDGRDPEFGRGSTISQRHLGDISHKPNPCVAPILYAPFFAMRIYPADLGTAIGMKVDAQARYCARTARRLRASTPAATTWARS